AIVDAMVWRHPDAAMDDQRPVVASFNMADVCYLIMGIHDFFCLPEWTGVEVKEEPPFDVRSALQRLPFYCTLPTAIDDVILDPTPKDLAVGTPSSKIIAKGEASQKRTACTSDATLSHVAKRTRSTLAQLSGSATRPSLFVGDYDESDDVACVEIPLVTSLRSTVVILSSGNQGESFATPTAEDSQGEGVMVDDAVAPPAGVSQPRPSSGPVPSFRNVFDDAIHMDFFPFSTGPYYATYHGFEKEVFKDPTICKTIVDQFPTPREMVRVKSLSDDQLTTKMSVLHCMMMSHDGELLARYHGLNQSHHEYVLSTDSRLKVSKEKVASLTWLELQVSALKKQVSGVNDKLSSSNASFTKSKAKGKERKKKIKSLTKSVDNFHSEVAHLPASLNQATVLVAEKDEKILRVQGELLSLAASAGFERGLSMHQTKDEFTAVLKKMTNFIPGAQDRLAEASSFVAQTNYAYLNKIFEHATEPLLVILQLEPKILVHPANIPTSREAHASPPTKESTVTPVSKSLELSANVSFTASALAPEHNEEMGISVDLDDVVEMVEAGSGRVSSGPNDVVVALSAGEKGDGLDPSSATGEGRVVRQRTLIALRLGQTDYRCVVVHPADPESCHPP
nr:hypothetical protein [Tanacetum cinerariifolium]